MKRFPKFNGISDSQWTDWAWQQKNTLNNQSDLVDFFPNATDQMLRDFDWYREKYYFQLTPYLLSLIEYDDSGNPLSTDPIWRQVSYFNQSECISPDDYHYSRVNWEVPAELPTPILHHKYPGRVILRVIDSCLSYCNYCYLTSRVLDRQAKHQNSPAPDVWKRSIDYLRAHPEINDVLISGGDPLLLNNDRLSKLLADLRAIHSVQSIRINTRALSFNPYRVDSGFCELLKEHRITGLELHMSHPRELSNAFDQAIARIDASGYRPLLLWRAPLLAGVNDDSHTLQELFLGLYRRRIQPYYLFHYAPYSLGRSRIGVPVRDSVRLMKKLRRRIPGPAFPRYTLFHVSGKQDIPLEINGTPEFRYERDEKGLPLIRFTNWKGELVSYPDIPVDEG